MFFLVKSSHPDRDMGDTVINVNQVTEFAFMKNVTKKFTQYVIGFRLTDKTGSGEVHADEATARARIRQFLALTGADVSISDTITIKEVGGDEDEECGHDHEKENKKDIARMLLKVIAS